jgi:hypothetical protein
MPSDDKVKVTAVYNILSEHATRLEREADLGQGKLDAVEAELRALRETRMQYEEAIQVRPDLMSSPFRHSSYVGRGCEGSPGPQGCRGEAR